MRGLEPLFPSEPSADCELQTPLYYFAGCADFLAMFSFTVKWVKFKCNFAREFVKN